MSILHATLQDPFHERHSDVFGQVRLYSPEAEPEEWGSLPWVLTTERSGSRGDNGPIRVKLKPEYLMKAFNSPGLITKGMQWPEAD